MVIVASGMAAALYKHGVEKFTLTGNITSGIPSFKPPSFTLQHDNHTYTATDFFEVRTRICVLFLIQIQIYCRQKDRLAADIVTPYSTITMPL